VEVKNQENKYIKLDPIDINDIDEQGMTEFMNSEGTPKYYDIQSDVLFLYPKPQTGYVTFDEGLKVYFQRASSYFSITDTTKTPGFASIFHRLVARWACYDYALSRQLPIANNIRGEITLLEKDLTDFYASKNSDESISIRSKKIQWN
jgi:hypothetical protein